MKVEMVIKIASLLIFCGCLWGFHCAIRLGEKREVAANLPFLVFIGIMTALMFVPDRKIW